MASGTHPRVVIVGGGFGGLYAAQALRKGPLDVVLVDRRNFHLFQPLLYQVATGGLSPADIASPLRAVLGRQANCAVLQAEAIDLDAAGRRLVLDDGTLAYDYLVVATGASHHYFGNDGWAAQAPGLKTIEDATEIRGRILSAFERAERESDPERRRALTTFLVIGAGPTGVELAGAIAELARATLRGDFRSIRPEESRIVLVEAADRVLTTFPPSLSARARRSLERLGVEVACGATVADVDESGVVLRTASGTDRIAARTVLWAAGVKGSSLGRAIESRTGARLDRGGRVRVEPDCSVPGHPEIFVIGDLAAIEDPGGREVPGVAPAAMQMGSHVARVILDRLAGRPSRPFRYRDRGNLAVIGRAAAVAHLGRLRFGGYPAWLLWLFVHILYIVEYENRALVLLQWAWSYLTRNQGARLITAPPRRDPEDPGKQPLPS